MSTTVTKPIASSLWNTRAIFFLGCAAQVFFFLSSSTDEFYLLTIMPYNHSVSICQPLHDGTLLGSTACVRNGSSCLGQRVSQFSAAHCGTLSLPSAKAMPKGPKLGEQSGFLSPLCLFWDSSATVQMLWESLGALP